jgi:hypothetical protein
MQVWRIDRMKVAEFNSTSGTVTVRTSKPGKPRHVALTDAGQQVFAALTIGRKGSDPISPEMMAKFGVLPISKDLWKRLPLLRRSSWHPRSTFSGTHMHRRLP